MKSTTRFRNTDPWPEETSTHPPNHVSCLNNKKLRLICSNGGHIVPRPHDKSLRYIGGETRMVVVDRHTTLLHLTRRLSKTFITSSTSTDSPTNGYPFTIKYQLPSEDLDSLISVTTDEDVTYMIEEYDRLTASSSSCSRLRLFMFPTDPESVSLIGSVLENAIKSEDWLVNALNGTDLVVSDTSSFNCLLNLDDEMSPPEKEDVNEKGRGVTSGLDNNGNGSGQDVHSIPDSLQMETTSSFGSESSTPSIANLPPVKVNSDDHRKVTGGIEEHFSQMSIQQHYLSDLTGNNDRSADPNDTIDQTAKVKMQPPIENAACLLPMPTAQINSPRNQLNHQQPRFISPPQYIHHHHHPSGPVPLASYYHHSTNQPPTDQQNFVYYVPSRQLPAATIPPSDQTILQTELATVGYRTTNSGAPQPVTGPYVGYSEIYQPSQHICYATQAMPQLSVARYGNMATVSSFEAGLQEQVRSAFP